ncbi:hypothetical protein B0H10DRAFT_2216990 [Mycena sp. CBHHK59/15]|nr:hypothetical protein B0H10DRAFT_2216990 [Mycena sp. CBHHK59/15]
MLVSTSLHTPSDYTEWASFKSTCKPIMDSWTIKASVIAITFFESFEMASYFSASYSYLIDGFGNRQNLRIYNWQTMAALLTVYLSTFVAQIYFAHCIYRLHQKSKVIPIIIVVLALACLGGGIGQVVRK